jgi:RimJ/RimL family protein N-acetyltransferase
LPAEAIREVRRTWDGLEIASDEPTGSTVVVRRHNRAGELELLLLHRQAHGPGYEGDWAWTGPAGCRQPGEAVYPAALRELAEEAGLVGLAPWAVDLSGRWALFAVDVSSAATVELVDPEHDRYEWAPPDAVARRMLPAMVAEGQLRAAAVPKVDLRFRQMSDADFGLVARWHREPHVFEWWDHASLDEEAARARYEPRGRGDDPTRMWIVEADDEPAGVLQSYRVSSYADYAQSTGEHDAAAFDYLLGEPGLIGRGLGTRMVWEFCRDVLRPTYPDAPRFLASPSVRNARSLRVLEKCGFARGRTIAGEEGPDGAAEPELVCTLDVTHWFGR